MGIFISKKGYFHLQTRQTSYIFHVLANGDLVQVYYGRKIAVKDSYDQLCLVEERGFEPYTDEGNTASQPSLHSYEYATYGKGDFRHPAYQIQTANGSRVTHLIYDSYEIWNGKERLTGLPSSFAQSEDKVASIRIRLLDSVQNLVVDLYYTIFEEQDVLVRSTRFENLGQSPLRLLRACSMQLDLPDSRYDVLHFPGAWLRERHLERVALHSGLQGIDSLRGSSSPQQNPFFMLARPETNEDFGPVYAFNLIYSGNHFEQIEVDHFKKTRILVGINPQDFSWLLEPGEVFQTPEAVLSYSSKGFQAMSQQLGEFYQEHLVNPRFAKLERPILINSWEAAYCQVSAEKMKAFADKAKELGIELLVIDDGWYGHRDDDSSSLGDWSADFRKFPRGLGELADYVHSIGLQFGLWFEPEMVSKDSDLYREHPDWRLEVPGYEPSLGRQQFVLDCSRTEVIDYLFEQMSEVIRETQLDYIKWDMNRHMTDLYSLTLPNKRQQEVAHRYILGVYRLYQRLLDAFPNVLFESCASGGGRFDLGMMYYAPQAWTSDDTDPIERLYIQHGTSYGYPLSMMTGHVSVAPNHQTERVTSLKMREAVAYFSVLGYELDITQLSYEECKRLKEGIDFYKSHRQLFQFGRFYRLISPFDGIAASWQVVSPDQTLSILAYYQIRAQANPAPVRIYLRGLDSEKRYHISGYNDIFYGDELMRAGLQLPLSRQEGERVLSTHDGESLILKIEELKSEKLERFPSESLM